MSGNECDIYGGVDTHRDIHVAAVVDGVGRVVGSESFAADESGYGRMVAWFRARGVLVRVGVEGCGSYGAGLARYLTAADIEVVEVNRPNRQLRRLRGGKSDSVDAEGAARAAASGQATAVPKSGDGPVECIRMLVVARRSATKARTQAANQIHSLVVTAPEQVKHQLKGLKLKARVRVCARWRPGQAQTTTAYAKRTLRHLARRYQTLDAEINQLDTDIRRLCARANPALLAAKGVGPDTASALLAAAGDNPERMKSEKSFAALCGASPSRHHPDKRFGIVSTGAATAKPTRRCGGSLPPGYATTLPPNNTWPNEKPKERTEKRSSAASSGTSPERSTGSSLTRRQPRTAPGYAAAANKPASPSPRPPNRSEHIPAVSQPSS